MIPYQLKIQGIRDYDNRILQFGDAHEHILITGPNGVGKSTLIFCMGAVFYSGKVDVEGLRSTNLAADEPWQAKITFVFLNEGATKIAGPKFVAFELNIFQPAKNEPYQRVFKILTGIDSTKLLAQRRYASGEIPGRTFSDYKQMLQEHYKIDPDLYHLIWYQQQVNQFAAMYPEERFEKFSDMFGITEARIEWESVREKMKDLEREIQYLKAVQKGTELNVTAAKNELDYYLDNKRRVIEYGRSHYTLLQQLIEQSQQKQQRGREERTETERALQEQLALEQQKQQEVTALGQQKQQLEEQQKVQDEQQKALYEQIAHIEQVDRQQLEEQQQLEQALLLTSDQRRQLRYDEQTLTHLTEEARRQLEQLMLEGDRLKEQAVQLKVRERSKIAEQLTLQQELSRQQQELERAQKDKLIYVSSGHIREELAKIEQENVRYFERRHQLEQELEQLTSKVEQYRTKSLATMRQQQGLRDLKRKQMEAYPLHELIELMPDKSPQVESYIAAIKYTIFYVGKDYEPINDLYYVSLSRLIPTESVSKISGLGLQIREDLDERVVNYADKALWWVKEFFVSPPKIQRGILHDAYGARGAQETEQFILSEAAVGQGLAQYEKQLAATKQALAQVMAQYTENKQLHSELQGHLRTIRESESALLNQSMITLNKQRLHLLQQELEQIHAEQIEQEIATDELKQQLSEVKYQLGIYESQWTIIEDLGEHVHLQVSLQDIMAARLLYKQQLQSLEHQQEELSRQSGNIRREWLKCEEQLQDAKRALVAITHQIAALRNGYRQLDERLAATEAIKGAYEEQFNELTQVLPEEAQQLEQLEIQNEEWLLAENEKLRVALRTTRLEVVNEHAERNYRSIKADFDQKNAQLAHAEQRFEVYDKRARELEEQLEVMIHLSLTKINALFCKYMESFQFEGVIECERVEEKSGRVKYLLYLKVRKIGHQGQLEEVSAKARSGKFGKGVSGGEESLSSLLFALALLKNLSISPGYIVLDEFDSALDDARKNSVFTLYAEELQRKLLIVSPKGHDEDYYNHFSKVYVVEHDASIPKSMIRGIQNVSRQLDPIS